MKIGCSTWSFHHAFEKGEIDIYGFTDICADELELDGVELLDMHLETTGEDLSVLKNYIVRKGLSISCVSVSNNFGYSSAGKLRDEVAKVKRWIDIAGRFGSPVIRVFSGWEGPAPWDVKFGREREEKKKVWPGMIRC